MKNLSDNVFIRSIDVKRLNRLVNELRKRGLWAERHSYSIRIIYNNIIVASLHLYPGFNEAILRLYGGFIDNYVYNIISRVLREVLGDFKLVVERVTRDVL